MLPMFHPYILYELQDLYRKYMHNYTGVVDMMNNAPVETRHNIMLIIRRAKSICELYGLDQEHVIYILVNGGEFNYIYPVEK